MFRYTFKKRIFLLVGTLLIVMGCTGAGEQVPDDEEPGSMNLEYDFMQGYNLVGKWEDYSEYVGIAFLNGGISTTFIKDEHTNHILPEYEGGAFPNDEQKLRQYAKDHLNHGWKWHFLIVDHYAVNPPGALYVGGRSTSVYVDNQPPSPAEERYSMVFWQDIMGFYTSAEDTTFKKIAVTFSVHELGHQRAGLTDYIIGSQYHNPLDQNGDLQADCVENGDQYFTNIDLYTLKPIFCYDTDPNDTIDNNSCVENLQANANQF